MFYEHVMRECRMNGPLIAIGAITDNVTYAQQERRPMARRFYEALSVEATHIQPVPLRVETE